jgi:acyl carrier protein
MKSRAEIADRIRTVVEEVTQGSSKAASIDGSASLLEDLRLDSLDYATVLLGCEEWLGVRVPEDRVDWRRIGTVDGLAGFLFEQQPGAGSSK